MKRFLPIALALAAVLLAYCCRTPTGTIRTEMTAVEADLGSLLPLVEDPEDRAKLEQLLGAVEAVNAALASADQEAPPDVASIAAAALAVADELDSQLSEKQDAGDLRLALLAIKAGLRRVELYAGLEPDGETGDDGG